MGGVERALYEIVADETVLLYNFTSLCTVGDEQFTVTTCTSSPSLLPTLTCTLLCPTPSLSFVVVHVWECLL